MKAVSPLRQRFPFGGVLLGAIAGILLASWLGNTWGLLIGVLGILLCLFPFWRQGGIVFALTVAVFALLQLWSWNDAPARKFALWLEAHPQELVVEGIVTEEPKLSPSGMATFPIGVERITGLDDSQGSITLPVRFLVRWPSSKDASTPVYGDRVSFQAIAERPPAPRNPGGFDYREWLERHQIYTQFSVDPSEPGKILSQGHGNPVMAWAIMTRHQMEKILSSDMEGASMELSAIKGITLGVTENAPEGFTEDFRFTGTMHLFAVSGLHVGMLAVMIWFVLMAARIPRTWAVAIIIPMLFFYVTVTGLKAGSIRSASMVSLLLCGSVLYRRSPLFNSLAAAALIQLAIDPNALFSAGWQFSYCVVFAILAITPYLEEHFCKFYSPDPFIPPKLLSRSERWRFASWNDAAGLVAVSTAAWIGSFLPTIAYFHLISFSAIGANLLAVPLAFIVLALGALSLLSGGCSLWIAGAFNNANWLVAKLLLLVVQTSALIPGGHCFVGLPTRHPVVTILDLNEASCAVIQNGHDFALVNAGRKHDAERDILPFLESCGANAIRSLLITKSDAAHLGGVPDIEREMKVESFIASTANPRSIVAKSVLREHRISSEGVSAQTGELLPGVGRELIALHDGTMGVRLQCDKVRILFLPPLTPEITKQILSELPPEAIKADILILPLGGSALLATQAVISKIAPRVLLSPVDAFNREGVPSGEWNQWLSRENIRYVRQDESGGVSIEIGFSKSVIRTSLSKDQFFLEN